MPPRDDDEIITQNGTRRGRPRLNTATMQAVDEAAAARLEDAHQRMDAIDQNVLAHARDIRHELRDVREDVQVVHAKVAHIEGQMVHLVRSYERTAEQAAREASAQIELRKAERLLQLQDVSQDRAARRQDASQDRAARRAVWTEFGMKAAAIVMGAWALVSALVSRGC